MNYTIPTMLTISFSVEAQKIALKALKLLKYSDQRLAFSVCTLAHVNSRNLYLILNSYFRWTIFHDKYQLSSKDMIFELTAHGISSFWQLTGIWGVVPPPYDLINYWTYDHEIFTRCQMSYRGTDSRKFWSVRTSKLKNAQ